MKTPPPIRVLVNFPRNSRRVAGDVDMLIRPFGLSLFIVFAPRQMMVSVIAFSHAGRLS
jgi:hypothetical protein